MHWRLIVKNRIITILFLVAVAFSGITGLFSVVNADNDTYSYTFYNGNTSGNIAGRAKLSDCDVYVHQISGPALKYKVQGSKTGTTWSNRSSQLTLHSGYQAYIENSVYDHKEKKARLHLVRTTTAYTNTIGYWDPDL